ncbi:MAG: FliH/SctL family protein [Pseudomonadota bacterium]
MFREIRIGQVMPVGEYDAANSAPVPLARLSGEPRFEQVPLGRTPWPSAEDLKQLMEKAQEEGLAQGTALAEEKAAAERQRESLAVRHLLEGLTQPLDDLNEELLRELALLALRTGAMLARRELTCDPEALIGVISEALAQLPPERPAQLALHPADAELLTERLAIELPQLTVTTDDKLQRGDCRISADATVVDGSIDTQLARLIAALPGGQ